MISPCPQCKAHVRLALSFVLGQNMPPQGTPAFQPSSSGAVLQGWTSAFPLLTSHFTDLFVLQIFRRYPNPSRKTGINKPNQQVRVIRPGTQPGQRLLEPEAALLEAAGPRDLAERGTSSPRHFHETEFSKYQENTRP